MPHSTNDTAVYLLKGAAVVFALLGIAFLVWVTDQWIHFPEARASQFDFRAPLWPALGGFVLIATIAAVALFWRAAERVKTGEDLFSQRHRKHPDAKESASSSSSPQTNGTPQDAS